MMWTPVRTFVLRRDWLAAAVREVQIAAGLILPDVADLTSVDEILRTVCQRIPRAGNLIESYLLTGLMTVTEHHFETARAEWLRGAGTPARRVAVLLTERSA